MSPGRHLAAIWPPRRLTLALALLPWPALGHGSADWIMREPRYLDARGMHCCGPTDCSVVPAAAIVERDGGVELVGHGFLPLAQRGHYRAIDGQWWACVDTATGRLKCVFHPARGA